MKKLLVVMILALGVGIAGFVSAGSWGNMMGSGRYGMGPGMMGGSGYGYGMGPGMMGSGYGNHEDTMMGPGYGNEEYSGYERPSSGNNNYGTYENGRTLTK